MKLGKKIKDEFFKRTNLSYSQLKEWSRTESCRIEPNSDDIIRTTLRLLFRKKMKWTEKDSIDAIKINNFIKQKSVLNRNLNIVADGYTRIGIQLKNRGYDVKAA